MAASFLVYTADGNASLKKRPCKTAREGLRKAQSRVVVRIKGKRDSGKKGKGTRREEEKMVKDRACEQ